MSGLNLSMHTVLKQKSIYGIPNNVVCLALNYITHRIMLCTKDFLFLYDLDNQNLLQQLAYAKKFEKIYDSDVRIKSLDAVILSSLWVTFVNKKSFLFFNDNLEFSRIYSAEPNPALSLQVVQRTSDMLTLRGDRKMLKFWRFEYQENTDSDKIVHKAAETTQDGDKTQNKGHSNKKSYLSQRKDRSKETHVERIKLLTDKGQSFEVNLYTRKSISMAQGVLIMNVVFSEELGLVAMSLDSMDVVFYNIISCDHVQTLNFSQSVDKNLFNIPAVSIDQELLYYCDEKRIVIFDLISNQEISNTLHNFPSKILAIHAEKSNPHGGVYLIDSDERLHVYSYANKRIIWSETLPVPSFRKSSIVLNNGSGSDSARKLDASPVYSNRSVKFTDSMMEMAKRDQGLREKFYKSRFELMTNTSNSGLTNLLLLVSGRFLNLMKKIYEVSNPAIAVHQTRNPISEIESIVDISNKKVKTELIKIKSKNNKYTACEFDTFKEMPKYTGDWVENWKKANYDAPSSNHSSHEQIENMHIQSVHPIPGTDMCILATHDYIHIVQQSSKKRMMHRCAVSDVRTCIAIPINDESYYVILGTSKGVVVIMECDFAWKRFSILKSIIRHDSVVTLKYLSEVKCLLTIGSEGNIFLFDIQKPYEYNNGNDEELDLFQIQQSHRLMWNQISCVGFLSDSQIVAGLGNGVIQCVRYNWKRNLKKESELLEYHDAPITHIVTVQVPAEGFLSCCEQNLVAYWHVGRSTPLRVFRLADPVHTLMLYKNPNEENFTIYVGLEHLILKLNYEFGGQTTSTTHEDKLSWKEATFNRMKFYGKVIKESKTLNPILAKILESLKTKKIADNDISSGPLLFNAIFNNEEAARSKSLEFDYLRYIASQRGPRKKGSIYILDTILSEFFEKKVSGEAIISKQDNKVDRKGDGNSISENLMKTLKKYPVIKSIFIEKHQKQERDEKYRKAVLVLNEAYSGNDNINDQQKFLETECDFGKEGIETDALIRAKALYGKKPETSGPAKPSKKRTAEIPALPLIKTDGLSTVKSAKFLLKSSYSSNRATTTERGTSLENTYKSYTKKIEKEMMMRPLILPHEAVRSIVNKNQLVKLTNSRNNYQTLSSSRSRLLATSTTEFTLPNIPSSAVFLTQGATSSAETPITLGISHMDHTLSSPALTTSRIGFFKTEFPHEPKIKKEQERVDTSIGVEFPIRSNKDFVASHAQGYLNPDNTDLYKHFLRHILIKQHIFIKREQEDKERARDKDSILKTKRLDTDVEYMPITIKQFIVDTSKEQMALLSQIPEFYERALGKTLTDSPLRSEFKVTDLEEMLQKENNFLEDVLHKINENGIETVGLDDMVKFKQIVNNRMNIFSKVEDYMQTTADSEQRTLDGDETAIREEFLDTIKRIQEVRTRLGIADLKRSATLSAHALSSSRTFTSPDKSPKKRYTHNIFKQPNSMSSNTQTMLQPVPTSINVSRTDNNSGVFPIKEEQESMTITEDFASRQQSQASMGFPSNKLSVASVLSQNQPSSGGVIPERPSELQTSNFAKYQKASTNESTKKYSTPNNEYISPGTSTTKLDGKTDTSWRPGQSSKFQSSSKTQLAKQLKKLSTIANSDPQSSTEQALMSETQRLSKFKRSDTVDVDNSQSTKMAGFGASKTQYSDNSQNISRSKKIKKRNPNTSSSSGSLVTSNLLGKKNREPVEKRKDSSPVHEINSHKSLPDQFDEKDETDEVADDPKESAPIVVRSVQNVSTPDKSDPLKVKTVKVGQLTLSEAAKNALKNLGNISISDILHRSTGGFKAPANSVDPVNKIKRFNSFKVEKKIDEKDAEAFGLMSITKRAGSAEAKKRNEVNETPSNQLQTTCDASTVRKPESQEVLNVRNAKKSKEQEELHDNIQKYGLRGFEIDDENEKHKRPQLNRSHTVDDFIIRENIKKKKKEEREEREAQKRPSSGDYQSHKQDALDVDFTAQDADDVESVSPVMEIWHKKHLSMPNRPEGQQQKVDIDSLKQDSENIGKLFRKKFLIREATPSNFQMDESPSSRRVIKSAKPNEKEMNLGDSLSIPIRKTVSNRNSNKSFGPVIQKIDLEKEVNTKMFLKLPDSKDTPKRNKPAKSFGADRNSQRENNGLQSHDSAKNSNRTHRNLSEANVQQSPKALTRLEIKIQPSPRRITAEPSRKKKSKKFHEEDNETPLSRETPFETDSTIIETKQDLAETPTLSDVIVKKSKLRKSKLATKKKKKTKVESESSLKDITETTNNFNEEEDVEKDHLSSQHEMTQEALEDDGGGEVLRAHSQRKRTKFEKKESEEDMMEDPLTLFSRVMKEASIDQQTKLDLFLYSNRKQVLRDNMKEMENNIELNILAQRDCTDQLAAFFDSTMNNMLKPQNNLAFSHNFVAPTVEQRWGVNYDNNGNPDVRLFNPRSNTKGQTFINKREAEYLADIQRKRAFGKNKDFLNYTRNMEQKLYSGISDPINESSRKAEIIMSDNIIETLLRKGDEMVSSFGNVDSHNDVDLKNLQMTEKLQKFKDILISLKKNDTKMFLEYLQLFEDSKVYYEETLKDGLNRIQN